MSEHEYEHDQDLDLHISASVRAESIPIHRHGFWEKVDDDFAAFGETLRGETLLDPAVVPLDTREIRRSRGRVRLLVAFAACLTLVLGLGVWARSAGDGVVSTTAVAPGSAEADRLPGTPRMNRDHWNALYAVYDCRSGSYLDPFQSTLDPLGIHSHGDGLISIHPFFEESAGENARLRLFFDAMEVSVGPGGWLLPDGGALPRATTCDGAEAALHLRKWRSDGLVTVEDPEVIVGDIGSVRFLNDREVYLIALAPLDAELPPIPQDRVDQLLKWGPAVPRVNEAAPDPVAVEDQQEPDPEPTAEPTVFALPAATCPTERPFGIDLNDDGLFDECHGSGEAPDGTYATARQGAGNPTERDEARGQRSDDRSAGVHPDGRRIIPVFDRPDSEERTLVYEYLDGSEIDYPLANPMVSDEPLVLRVLEFGPPGWLRVQAPVRPNGNSVWVRSGDVVLGRSEYRIEVDVGPNLLRLYEGAVIVLETSIASGRADRPTALQSTYIEQAVPGPSLAYGSWLVRLGAYSDSLSTFSGGLPGHSIHGTNRPELLDERVSSGEIRVPNEIIEIIAEQVPAGSPVVLFDSSSSATDYAAITAREGRPATTVPATMDDLLLPLRAG